MGNITVKDVAKRADVSATTVSRVIRGKSQVSPEVRERVLEAVSSLNYVVNRNARSLVKGKSSLVGVLIGDISNPFYSVFLRGLEDGLRRMDFNLIFCSTDENPSKEEKYLRMLLEHNVSSLVIVPTHPQVSLLRCFEAQNIPIVCVDRKVEGVKADVILVDNFHGGMLATEYLLKQGYTRIGVVSGSFNIPTLRDRFLGYKTVLEDYGIPFDDSLVREGGFTIEEFQQAAQDLLTLSSPPSAIFSTGNTATVGVYSAINKLGKRILTDIGVIGFDDLPWVYALNPPLTVISQPVYQIGFVAGQLAIQRMFGDGPKEKQEIVLETSLIIRGSC